MRLLVVNPNTSEGVTRRIAEAAEAVAQPADRFVTRSAAFGPSLIVTPGDARRAVEGVLATVAAHGDGILDRKRKREPRLLWHRGDQSARLTCRQRRDVVAVDRHPSLRRLHAPTNRPQECRLSSPVWTDEADEFSRVGRE